MNSLIDRVESTGVDLLLKRFLVAEMPAPWPAFNPPSRFVASTSPRPQFDSLRRSRLTLIVAMSLLCAFVAMMGSYVGGPSVAAPRPEKGLIENGTAKIPKELLKKQP